MIFDQASHGPWVISCYQELAKQLTVALKHEEKRCQYLSTQAKIMSTVHDEVASLPEGRHVLYLFTVRLYIDSMEIYFYAPLVSLAEVHIVITAIVPY